MIPLRVLGDRVLIKPQRNPDQTASGLHLPESRADQYAEMQGTVAALGHPLCATCASHRESCVQVGDHVLFSWSVGQQITLDEEVYLLMRESELLAIVESEPE